MISPVRLQCVHVIEVVRRALGVFLYAQEQNLLKEPKPQGNNMLYSQSEITQVLRIKQGDIFCYSGVQDEHIPEPHGSPAKKWQYQFSIPSLRDSLRVSDEGWVGVNQLDCHFQGNVSGVPFHANRVLTDFPALDLFVVDTLRGLLNPYHPASGNLKDISTFLKLAPTLRYPFGKGFNREFYEKVFRKNSFCIGWRPELATRKSTTAEIDNSYVKSCHSFGNRA
jgi:hypothetical protein